MLGSTENDYGRVSIYRWIRRVVSPPSWSPSHMFNSNNCNSCECYNFCGGNLFSCDDDKVWSTTCESELVMGCVKADLGEGVDTLGDEDTQLIKREQCSPTSNAEARCPGLMQGVTEK